MVQKCSNFARTKGKKDTGTQGQNDFTTKILKNIFEALFCALRMCKFSFYKTNNKQEV